MATTGVTRLDALVKNASLAAYASSTLKGLSSIASFRSSARRRSDIRVTPGNMLRDSGRVTSAFSGVTMKPSRSFLR